MISENTNPIRVRGFNIQKSKNPSKNKQKLNLFNQECESVAFLSLINKEYINLLLKKGQTKQNIGLWELVMGMSFYKINPIMPDPGINGQKIINCKCKINKCICKINKWINYCHVCLFASHLIHPPLHTMKYYWYIIYILILWWHIRSPKYMYQKLYVWHYRVKNSKI